VKKSLLTAVLAVFLVANAFAFWDKPSAVRQSAYDELVKKNIELKQALDSLTADYEKLQELYKILMEKVKGLQADKEDLLKSQERLKADLAGKPGAMDKRQLAHMKEGMQSALTMLRASEEKTRQLEGVEAELRSQLDKISSEKDGALKQLQDTQDTIKKLQTQLDSKDTQLQETQDTIKKLQTELGSKDTEIKDQAVNKHTLDTSLKDIQSQLDKISSEKNDALKQLQDTQDTIKKFQTQLGFKDAQLQETQDTIKKLQTELGSKDTEIKDQAVNKHTLDTSLKDIQSQLDKISSEKDGALKQLDETRKTLQKLQTELDSKNARLKTTSEDLSLKTQEAPERYLSEIRSLKTSLGRSDKEITRLSISIGRMDKTLSKMASEKQKRLKTMGAYGEELAFLAFDEKEYKKLESDVLDLKKSIQENEAKKSELAGQMEQSKEQLRVTRERKEDILKTISVKEKQTPVVDASTTEASTAARLRMENFRKQAAVLDATEAEQSAAMAHLSVELQKTGDNAAADQEHLRTMEERSEILKEKSASAQSLKNKIEDQKNRLKILEASSRDLNNKRTNVVESLDAAKDRREQIEDDLALKKELLSRELVSRGRAPEAETAPGPIPQKKASKHYNLGVQSFRARDYAEAEREFLRCVQIDPNDADAHYNLGVLYEDKLHRYGAALVHYKQFLSLRPVGLDAIKVRQWVLKAESEKRFGTSAD